MTSDPQRPWLSVVIPVFNERKTIEEILQRVQDVDVEREKEIVVVDDGSQDGTRDFLEQLAAASLGRGAAGALASAADRRGPQTFACSYRIRIRAKALRSAAASARPGAK